MEEAPLWIVKSLVQYVERDAVIRCHCAIVTVNWTARTMRVEARSPTVRPAGVPISIGGMTVRAARRGRPVYEGDVRGLSEPDEYIKQIDEVRSELAVPVVWVEDSPASVVVILSSEESDAFSDDMQAQIAQAVAEAALEITSACALLDAERERAGSARARGFYSALDKARQRLTPDITQEELAVFYEEYCQAMARLLGATSCSLWLLTSEGRWAVLTGVSDPALAPGRMADLHLKGAAIYPCVENKRNYLVENISSASDPRMKDGALVRAFPRHRLMAIPLLKTYERDEVFGILSVIFDPIREIVEIEDTCDRWSDLIAQSAETLEFSFRVEAQIRQQSFQAALERIAHVGDADLRTAAREFDMAVITHLQTFVEGASIFGLESDEEDAKLVCKASTGLFIPNDGRTGWEEVPESEWATVRYEIGEGTRTGAVAHREVAAPDRDVVASAYWGRDEYERYSQMPETEEEDYLDHWGRWRRPLDCKSCEGRLALCADPPFHWLAVPIVAGGRVVGVLRASDRKGLTGTARGHDSYHPFLSDVDEDLFRQAASVLSLIMTIEQTNRSFEMELSSLAHDTGSYVQRILDGCGFVERTVRAKWDADGDEEIDGALTYIGRAANVINNIASTIGFYTKRKPILDSRKTNLWKKVIKPIVGCYRVKSPTVADKLPKDFKVIDARAGDFKGIPSVWVAREPMSVVFTVLVENAYRFSIGGPAKHGVAGVAKRPIQVAADTQSDADNYIFAVRDYGIEGVPPADRDRLFEPGYRGRYAKKHKMAGSGLGLSTAKRIVEYHGGTIALTNFRNPTEFTVRLPKSLKHSGPEG